MFQPSPLRCNSLLSRIPSGNKHRSSKKCIESTVLTCPNAPSRSVRNSSDLCHRRGIVLSHHQSPIRQTTRLNSSSTADSSAIHDAFPLIERHGPGDGVITLNVGGKNFQTLRSTVAQNAVLMDHVSRAEANREVTKSDGAHGSSGHSSSSKGDAIFVDRDPKHFGMILTYLRNRADGVYYPSPRQKMMKLTNGSSATAINDQMSAATTSSGSLRQQLQPLRGMHQTLSCESYIHLPSDSQTLSEMYFEAMHYQIPTLSSRIASKQSLANIFKVFGSSNPFQMAAGAVVAGKRALAILGSLGLTAGTWIYAQLTKYQVLCEKEDNGVGDKDFWTFCGERWSELWKGEKKDDTKKKKS